VKKKERKASDALYIKRSFVGYITTKTIFAPMLPSVFFECGKGVGALVDSGSVVVNEPHQTTIV
jgi:hypothetical protein